MKFYNSIGPNPQVVRIFAAERGVELDMVEVDLMGGENRQADYLAKNPGGQLPCLELDDGSFLSESQAICLYLEGLHPEPNLFGASPEERAKIEMWSRRVELSLMMPVAQTFRNITGFFKDREKCVPEWGEVSAEIARDAATLFDGHLADNQFLLNLQLAF